MNDFPWMQDFLAAVRAHLAARLRRCGRIDSALLRTRPAKLPLAILGPPVPLCPRNPEHRLIAYGTLVPGGLFHHLLQDLPGDWRPCTIRGQMGLIRVYRSFRWNPEGEAHQAWLLTSPELPRKFAQLDRFEGKAYRRRLIPALVGGCLVAAYVYEGRMRV